MENASEALKMAAAVLIFIGALSIAIVGFTKAKQSADLKKVIRYYFIQVQQLKMLMVILLMK